MQKETVRRRRATLSRISDRITDRLALASEVSTTGSISGAETEDLFKQSLRVANIERRLATREGN